MMQGNEYRKQRERAGLTQKQLAERLGVHPMTISKRERDAMTITREAQIALRQVAEESREFACQGVG